MVYELQLPDVTIVPIPSGVVNVIPSQVQPVSIIGTVDINQPITITQPVNVILPSSGVTIGTVNQGLAGTQPWPTARIPHVRQDNQSSNREWSVERNPRIDGSTSSLSKLGLPALGNQTFFNSPRRGGR